MSYVRFSKTIKIRLALQFLTTFANTTVLPYIILFFSSKLGSVITGFMFLAVITSSVIGSMMGGHLADKLGRKKVIVRSELFVSLSFIAVTLANSAWFDAPYVTFMLFLVIYLFYGAVEPAYQALLIDASHPENRKAIYTLSYWLRNLAIALGGILGAFLFMDYHFYLFLGVAFCNFLSLVITLLFIKETHVPASLTPELNSKKAHPIRGIIHSYRKVSMNRLFTVFIIAYLLVISLEAQMTNYIAIRLVADMPDPQAVSSMLPFKWDGVNMLGILQTENTIAVVCLTIVFSYLIKKGKDTWILMIGLFLNIVGYTVLSFSSMPIVLLAAMLFASIGEILYFPVTQAMLADMVPDDARSTYMSVYTLSGFLAGGSAGIFIIISDWIPNFIMSGIFGLMGIVCLFLFARLSRTKQHQLSDLKKQAAV